MQLKTILNQCHKFKSFVYDKVRFVLKHFHRNQSCYLDYMFVNRMSALELMYSREFQ